MLFTAPLPAGVSTQKYAPSAVAMLAAVKYKLAVPSNRLEEPQASLGMPLPAATQAQLLDSGATAISYLTCGSFALRQQYRTRFQQSESIPPAGTT